MRLPIALTIATCTSALLSFVQLDSPAGEHPLQRDGTQESQRNIEPVQVTEISQTDGDGEENSFNLVWLWQAFSKVLLFVLFGWALAKIYLQLRLILAMFAGLVIITVFLLDLSGIMHVSFDYAGIERLFSLIKQAFMGMHFSDFLALLVGLWAGYADVTIGSNKLLH